MRRLKGFFITSILLITLFLIFTAGYEVYLKLKYPNPETYSEDAMAISAYCQKRIICEPSLVCKLRDIAPPMGGFFICSTIPGGTKGLSR